MSETIQIKFGVILILKAAISNRIDFIRTVNKYKNLFSRYLHLEICSKILFSTIQQSAVPRINLLKIISAVSALR